MSPETVQDRDAAVAEQVLPSGFDVTRYESTAAPPVSVGAAQASNTAELATALMVALPGAPGFVAGVIEVVEVVGENPSEFCAETAKV